MNKREAEYMLSHFHQLGFDTSLMMDLYDDGFELWYIEVDTHDGVRHQLVSNEAAEHFLQDHGLLMLPIDKVMMTQLGQEWNRRMHRYLFCSICGSHYSADPAHYKHRVGYLACCGRAVYLYQMNPMDHSEYLLADTVDVEYLQKPHMDLYAPCPPLPLVNSVQRPSFGDFGRPPAIPAALRQPIEEPPNYGLIGLMLYHAGYDRNTEGVWHQSKELHYAPFQDGDQIIYEITDTIAYELVKTHSIPDLYGFRFKEEKAA